MDNLTLLDQVARIIYEEGFRGAFDDSIGSIWPDWEELPESCARDCAYASAKSILSVLTSLTSWQPWETRPRDGTIFIATNGTEYKIGNEPEGCAFGEWRDAPHFNGGWQGSFIRLQDPTHWHPVPPHEPSSAP